MRKLAFRIFSKLPPFSWIIAKLLGSEQRIIELERAVQCLKAELAFPRAADELRALFVTLVPQRVVGLQKIRIGDVHDGGYVMLDDFNGATQAYSLGIADNVSWDLAIAERGIPVEQFDYSIPRSPVANARFHFQRKMVSGLSDILVSHEQRQLLKIDIEGSEWGFFADAPEGSLAMFTQIVGEFHGFDRYFDPAWQQLAVRALRKLNETHQLIHLHENNSTGFFLADGIRVPVLFEFTFVLRSAFQFELTDERFPSPLDAPNVAGFEEIPLEKLLQSSLFPPANRL
jgi:hypothetical protein